MLLATLSFVVLGLVVLGAAFRWWMVRLPAPPLRELGPPPVEHAVEARALGFTHLGAGRWVHDDGFELHAHDDGGSLRHLHRLVARGPWRGLSVRVGRMTFVPTGDPAFDECFVVEGEGIHRLDDAVRAAFMAHRELRLMLCADGELVAHPGDDGAPEPPFLAILAVRSALDAAPGSDAALAKRPHELGSVRAEALRRLRDEALARQLVDDPDPHVRLVAALMVAPASVRTVALDPAAPASLRHRAALSLPALDEEVLASLVASDAPALWSVVAKAELRASRRVELLRTLLRPGGLSASDWPDDPRVPHVGARLAMAIGEAPPADGEALLLQLLAMPEARVRLQAVRALEGVGGPRAVEAVRACFADDDARVRSAARGVAEALAGTARGSVSVVPDVGQGAVAVAAPAGGLSEPEEIP